jgi:hypothetical protein
MRLSMQQKQILLVLFHNNPNALRLRAIVYVIKILKYKKWQTSTEENKVPRPRVLSASICRSLKTMRARGLVTKQPKSYGSPQYHLTKEGLAMAREINRELELQIEKL